MKYTYIMYIHTYIHITGVLQDPFPRLDSIPGGGEKLYLKVSAQET